MAPLNMAIQFKPLHYHSWLMAVIQKTAVVAHTASSVLGNLGGCGICLSEDYWPKLLCDRTVHCMQTTVTSNQQTDRQTDG